MSRLFCGAVWIDETDGLSKRFDGLPGSLVVGEAAFARFHTLPQRASRATSAADSPTDQRTRDLLVCEHLALQTLAEAGISAAKSQLYSGEGRVFLEVERFDRTEKGRVGMVSLMVYDAEYVGDMDNWAATANRMAERQLLRPEDARTLRLLEAYGVLIANTDRHYGNISLLLKDDDWVLAPAYDMLPMLYAPVGGELVPREFSPGQLQPTAATLPEWPLAKTLAAAFWKAVAQDVRVSDGFRKIAAQNLDQIV